MTPILGGGDVPSIQAGLFACDGDVRTDDDLVGRLRSRPMRSRSGLLTSALEQDACIGTARVDVLRDGCSAVAGDRGALITEFTA